MISVIERLLGSVMPRELAFFGNQIGPVYIRGIHLRVKEESVATLKNLKIVKTTWVTEFNIERFGNTIAHI